MEPWILWVIAALLFFIIELMTAGFAVICLSIGAGAAAIVAACDATFNMQLLAFAAVSIIAIACVRPILKRTFFKGGEKVVTNASAIIGKRGIVLSDVDENDDTGRVIIDGIDWRAKSEGEKLPKDTRVIVTGIDSVILTVKNINHDYNFLYHCHYRSDLRHERIHDCTSIRNTSCRTPGTI